MQDVSSSLLGTIAVAGGYLTENQLQTCLHEQAQQEEAGRKAPRLGEIMKSKGFIDDSILNDLLEVQWSMSSGLFGEIAVRMKFVKPDQVEKALRIQNRARDMGYEASLIGELMLEQGFLTQENITTVLTMQQEYTVQCPDCGMKYNAWKLAPGQEINCAICGKLIRFEPSLVPDEDSVDRSPVWKEKDEHADTADTVPDIPGYVITGELGKSEDSILYKAVQTSRDREVTVQLMKGISSKNDEFMNRLQYEAKRAIALHHPSVKKIYAIGKHRGHPYIVSEFVHSESLFTVIRREGTLPLLGATEIIIQVAEALKAALNEGIVHGDIKPSLILMLDTGAVKLSNLGVAKKFGRDLLTADERSRFITYYMAPEIIIGKKNPDISSDIYSLGAVYFHMLTGKPPYEGKTPKEIIITISGGLQRAIAENPEIPPSVLSCLERMLSPVPEERYSTYDRLIADLGKITGDVSAGTSAAGRTTVRRRRTTDETSVNRRTVTVTGKEITERRYGRSRDQTEGTVMLIRALAVLIIGAVGFLAFLVLKNKFGMFNGSDLNKSADTQNETQDTAETGRETTEKKTDDRDRPNVKTGTLPSDVAERIDAYVKQAENDIGNYSEAEKGLSALEKKYGKRAKISDALHTIETYRVKAAENRSSKTLRQIQDALAHDDYKRAMKNARTFINLFYGTSQAREMEAERLDISEKMTQYFITAQEKAAALSAEGKHREAASLLDDVIQKLPESGLREKAEQLKQESEHALAVKEVEKQSSAGAGRMELFVRTHRKILAALKVLDVNAAQTVLNEFKLNPLGTDMEKSFSAMKEEIDLIRDLKSRIINLINKGIIKERCRTPVTGEEITITKADSSMITAGSVSLKWSMVGQEVITKFVTAACDITKASHLAQLAVFFQAAGDRKMATAWFVRSKNRGYDTETLAAAFPTQKDIEADTLYRDAVSLFKKGDIAECLNILTKLSNEYSDTSAVLVNAEEIQEIKDAIARQIREKEERENKEKKGEEGEEKHDPRNLKKLDLAFENKSDMDYITVESGVWNIEEGILVGKRKAGAAGRCMARIMVTGPYLFSGKIKFGTLNSAVALRAGDTRITADLTTNALFFEDTDKARKRMPFEFKADLWYEFSISVDRDRKKVKFVFGGVPYTGTCEVMSNDVVFYSDQENTIYMDNITIRMEERPTGAIIP